MDTVERIPVYIYIERGKTVCICSADCKGCERDCPRDTVTRDKYDGWERQMRQDRYGKVT